MSQVEEYIDDEEQLPYLEEHRPEAQDSIEGVIINPKQRADFDNTDNEERDELEVSDWWDRPYIKEIRFPDESWESYAERGKKYPQLMVIKTQKEFEEQNTKSRQEWLGFYPSGIRYDVRCLNGGAWDRSTNWGSYKTLEVNRSSQK